MESIQVWEVQLHEASRAHELKERERVEEAEVRVAEARPAEEERRPVLFWRELRLQGLAEPQCAKDSVLLETVLLEELVRFAMGC